MMGELGVFGRIGQVVLIIVNLLFAVLGIALLAAGSLLKYNEDLVNGYASQFLKQIQLEHLETNVYSIISSAALIFIIVGVFIFLLSLVGCCGACCQNRALLVVYAIVVILLLGVQIAVTVFTIKFKDEWQGPVKEEMKKVITNNYKGDNGTDVITLGINAVFMQFKCCGTQDYMDLVNVPGWARTYTFHEINRTLTFKAPYFCCKTVITETPAIDSGLFTNVDQTECATNPTLQNSNYKKGCFKALEEVVLRYSTIYLAVGISLIVLELFCIGFSCYICCMKRRQSGGKLV